MLSRQVIRLADGVHGVQEEACKLQGNLSAVFIEALLEPFRDFQRALYSCRMRRERLIRPTNTCKFNIVKELVGLISVAHQAISHLSSV